MDKTLFIVSGLEYRRHGSEKLFMSCFEEEEECVEYLRQLMGIGKYRVYDEIEGLVDWVDDIEPLKEDIVSLNWKVEECGKTVEEICKEIEPINGDGCDYIGVWKVIFGGLRKIKIL